MIELYGILYDRCFCSLHLKCFFKSIIVYNIIYGVVFACCWFCVARIRVRFEPFFFFSILSFFCQCGFLSWWCRQRKTSIHTTISSHLFLYNAVYPVTISFPSIAVCMYCCCCSGVCIFVRLKPVEKIVLLKCSAPQPIRFAPFTAYPLLYYTATYLWRT